MSLFRLMHYAIYHEDEPEKTYSWCYRDTTDAKDVGIEGNFVTSTATHEYEADDNDSHANSQQYVIYLIKCEFIHYFNLLRYLITLFI